MKFLIVGLGNPGVEYNETRHNVGFKVLDKFAKEKKASFKTEKLADICEVKHKGRKLILVKPNTFMNLSGKAVNYWLQQEKIPVENMMVVTDDIALPFGKLRFKPKGSDGGHNGLKDIQLVLNTPKYNRLRMGVGSEFNPGKQSNYVLGKWSTEEQKTIEDHIDYAIKYIESFASIGVERTMNFLNKK